MLPTLLPRRCLTSTSRSSPLLVSLSSRPRTYTTSRSTTLSQSTRPYTSFPRSSSYVSSPTFLELSTLPLLRRTYATPPPASNSSSATSDEVKLSKDAESLAKEMAAPPVPVKEEASKEVAKPKQTWPEKARAFPAIVMKELKHYWHGFKLLGKETKISWKLFRKLSRGDQLTRREQRQLKRTTGDLLRLIPFSVFIIIPGLELVLPVFLKFFPNMLPSTFEDKYAAEEKQRKLLRVRIGMAKFLQETVSEGGLKAGDVVRSDEFKLFFRKVRSTGESPSKEDIIKVAKLFNSDVTLDNLSRPQLVSMCKYMKIHAFGTDNFLRHQIRSRLDKIRRDDKVILLEGVDALSTSELQMACQSRGVRFTGVSPSSLRKELQSWIDLHYTNKVSGVLLVLSRAFHFNEEGTDVIKSLEATLSSLPDNLLSEAELTVMGEEATFQDKLDVLQQQQDLIDEEAEQEQEEEAARKIQREADEKIKAEEKARRDEQSAKENQEQADAVALLPKAELESRGITVDPEDARMTKEQVSELAEALSILSAKSSIVKERAELKALMCENVASEQDSKSNPDEANTVDTSLNKKIRSMITKIDSQLQKYDDKVGGSLKMIEVSDQGKISLADLEKALSVIKHAPEPERVHQLMEKLDSDHDGYVVLDHVVALTQDHGLGILMTGSAEELQRKSQDLKSNPRGGLDDEENRPKKEDIVKDE